MRLNAMVWQMYAIQAHPSPNALNAKLITKGKIDAIAMQVLRMFTVRASRLMGVLQAVECFHSYDPLRGRL